jgi:hypothetical protein
MAWNSFVTKALSFLGGNAFIGNGSNPLFGSSARNSTEDVFGQPMPQDMENLAAQHPVIRRCIELQAVKLLDAKIVIGREDEQGTWEPYDQETLARKLLLRPNKTMSWSNLLYFMVGNYRSTGVSYVWKMPTKGGDMFTRKVLPSPRDEFGSPQPDRIVEGKGELWPVPSSWVKQVMQNGQEESGTGMGSSYGPYPKSFTIVVPGAARIEGIDPKDMIIWRNPDFRDFNSAISSVGLAWRNARLDETDENYVAEHLINIRIPGVVINVPGGIGADAKTAIRAAFEQKLGMGRRGKPLFLEGQEAKLQTIPPVGDLGHSGMTSLNETRICTAMATPPILIGCWAGLQNSPWSNIGEAKKIFAQYTLVPMWLSLAEALTQGLIDPTSQEDGWAVAFDYDEISELQPDLAQNAGRASTLLTSGMATVNECRKIAGLQEATDGNVYLRGYASSPVPVGTGGTPPPEVPPASPSERLGEPVAGGTGKAWTFKSNPYRDEQGRFAEGDGDGSGSNGNESANVLRIKVEELPKVDVNKLFSKILSQPIDHDDELADMRTKHESNITKIREQIEGVRSKLEGLKASANASQTHIDEMKRDLGAVRDRAAANKVAMEAVTQRIAATRERLAASRARVSALSAKALGDDPVLEDELKQHLADMASLMEEANSIAADADTIANKVNHAEAMQ